MNKPRKIALGLTALIAVAILLWLLFAHITLKPWTAEWPPRHNGEVALVDEQFFDVIEEAPLPFKNVDKPSPVKNAQPESNASTPAPRTGDAVRNTGKPADAPSTATTKQPSPVKALPEEPQPSGPSQAEIDEQQEEEARRKANAAMNSAFNRASGSDNTTNNGKEPGTSGSTTGTSTGINGTGTGNVGGGWSMPSYAKVPATVTGSIRLSVKINKEGRVIAVTFLGGDAPAATDTRLRRAVENEVRSRRFTRGASAAPDESTAYITYRFR